MKLKFKISDIDSEMVNMTVVGPSQDRPSLASCFHVDILGLADDKDDVYRHLVDGKTVSIDLKHSQIE